MSRKTKLAEFTTSRKEWRKILLEAKLTDDSFHFEFCGSYKDKGSKFGKIAQWNRKTGDGAWKNEWTINAKGILKSFPSTGLMMGLRATKDCKKTEADFARRIMLPVDFVQWIENHLEINQVPSIYYNYETQSFQYSTNSKFTWEDEE